MNQTERYTRVFADNTNQNFRIHKKITELLRKRVKTGRITQSTLDGYYDNMDAFPDDRLNPVIVDIWVINISDMFWFFSIFFLN